MDRQPVLESDLVRLRPLTVDDAEALFAIASDPLLWEQHPSKERAEPEGFRAWFEHALASGGTLVAEDRTCGEVIGTSRFEGFDAVAREVEIGWTFVARSRWGGPWNAEMKRLMLAHAFRHVDTVVFRVSTMNVRSQRAVEKLGATRARVEPDALGRGDNVVFTLTRHELTTDAG